MRLISRQAFTMFELMVTIAVTGIVSSLVIRSTYTYLQEQKLRQAASEFVSYLLTARARALREPSVSGKACEVQLNVSTKTVGPTSQSANICNDSPGLPPLDLLAASGGRDLSITSTAGSSPFFITYTRFGTVAASNLSSAVALTLPRIFYFSNSATPVQRCVMVDINSLRIGWRNSAPTAQDATCTYNGS